MEGSFNCIVCAADVRIVGCCCADSTNEDGSHHSPYCIDCCPNTKTEYRRNQIRTRWAAENKCYPIRQSRALLHNHIEIKTFVPSHWSDSVIEKHTPALDRFEEELKSYARQTWERYRPELMPGISFEID